MWDCWQTYIWKRREGGKEEGQVQGDLILEHSSSESRRGLTRWSKVFWILHQPNKSELIPILLHVFVSHE